jgi:hypothetical protein
MASLLLHTGVRVMLSPEDSVAREAIADLIPCSEVLCYIPVQLHDALTSKAGAGVSAGAGAATPSGKKAKKAGAGAGGSSGKAAAAVSVNVPSVEERTKAMDVFVDVALSLLASPTRLMRDAINAAFRAFVGDATSASIEALMKVIMPGSGSDSKTGDEDDDGDDGEDDSEHHDGVADALDVEGVCVTGS